MYVSVKVMCPVKYVIASHYLSTISTLQVAGSLLNQQEGLVAELPNVCYDLLTVNSHTLLNQKGKQEFEKFVL